MTPQWLQREEALIGKDAVEKLNKAKVAVIGLGGVGSFVAEGLARAGVGTLFLMDGDKVDVTNINRQLVALQSTIGMPKAEVMKRRVLDINPDCKCESCVAFYDESFDQTKLAEFDFVVDAIDMVTSKLLLAVECKNRNISLLSAMGCGNKLDPSMFQIADIAKTKVCPLCRVMRRELRLKGVEHLPVLYSEEPSKSPIGTEDKRTPASISYVPSVAGLMMAGYVISELTKETD